MLTVYRPKNQKGDDSSNGSNGLSGSNGSNGSLPSCPRCAGAVVDASDYTIKAVRCVSCGWRKYGSFDIRRAEEPAARCACGNIIQKTGRIQTDKCDDCLRLWRMETSKLQHLASRKWREA